MIFGGFVRKFQLKIKNRESAGYILAEVLNGVVKKQDRTDTIVLGLASGGIIIAEIIAKKLRCEVGLIISRRLRAPHNEELAIGAIMEDGTTYLNESIIDALNITPEYINREISNRRAEIIRLAHLYIDNNKSQIYRNETNFENKIIIIVDDGAATGATIIATIRSIKKKANLKRLIVAVPVSPKGTVNLLRNEGIDRIEVITSPNDANFGTIEQYYLDFKQVSDEQVLDILRTIRK
jgi:predicted phosphoribosyltransferase